MIYQSISIKNILARAYRTFKLDGGDWIYDAVEFAGEAMEDIGHIEQFVRRACDLQVSSFKANLPTDLITLDMVWGEHGRIPYGGSKFELCHDDYLTGSAGNTSPFYQVEMDKLKVSFESGTVTVTYQAYPVDEDGFPLIPDIHEYKEAIVWRIITQMLLGGYMPKVQGLNFQYADQKYELFRVRAANRAKFPSPDRMEMIRRFFTNPVTNYSEWWSKAMTGIENGAGVDFGDGSGSANQGYNGDYYHYPNQLGKRGQNN